MIELPYRDDVWMLIVQYLPAQRVRSLYSVNRALFDIALDLRYKHTSFLGSLTSPNSGRDATTGA